MIIRDSLTACRKCRSVNVKNAKFDWTRTAMSLKFHYLFHFGFLGPHYFLQEISAEHRALTTFTRRFFRSLGNARLTAIKSAFGLDILLVYYLHPLVKIILDHESQTSTPFFKKTQLFFLFLDAKKLTSMLHEKYRIQNIKHMNPKKLSNSN